MHTFWDRSANFSVRQSARLGHWLPYHALQQTLINIMPLVLVGTWVRALTLSTFSRDGFFAQIYNLPNHIPYFNTIHNGLNVVSTFTIGIVALALAYFMALNVTALHGRPQYAAAITSTVSFLILNATVSNAGVVGINLPNLGIRGVFASVLLGTVVGWLFSHDWHLKRKVGPVPVTALLALITAASALLRLALYELASSGLTGIIYSTTSLITGRSSHAIIRIAANTSLNNLLSWFGVPGPINPLNPALANTQSSANLEYALAHASLNNVPYPVSMGTVYQPFAMFGGVGMTLGLLIAILWVSRQRQHRRLAKVALVPTIINVGTPMFLGYPLLLNPIMLIPYMVAPMASMTLAWAAIKTHIMPAAVYNVPGTAPGPFQAFLGTNGSWAALVVALLCLALSVLIYLPFVRIADRAAQQIQNGGEYDD